MTKSQCYAEITRNQNLIVEYQNQIRTLNTEISELSTMVGKIASMQSSLSGFKTTSVTRLFNTSGFLRINMKIINNICEGMSDVVSGQFYNTTNSGLDTAIGISNNEINTRNNQINTLNQNIKNCNTTIQAMYSEIARIEEEERAAAAAAAAAAEAEKANSTKPTV